PVLIKAHAAMRALPDGYWKSVKLAELEEVIRSCTGLWLEAIASVPSATPGDELKVTTAAVNRSAFPATLAALDVTYPRAGAPSAAEELKPNTPVRREVAVALPSDLPYTNPYWLAEKPVKGLFMVSDAALIGLPENPPILVARFTVALGGASGERIVFDAPV